MSSKKPNPDIEICFGASGVYPELIPVRLVADTLSAVHLLAMTSDEPEDDGDSISLRLLDIRRGSAIFRCVADEPELLIDGLRSVGNCIDQATEHERLAYALQPIKCLSRVAASLNGPVVIRKAGGDRSILATILPATYPELADALLVSGEKTIAGKVERAGGATRSRCALRVSFQSRLLHCNVKSTEVVRALGRYLYQEVVVTGTATWLRNSWRITAFDIWEVHQPQTSGLQDAFQALRELGGNAWDDIDDPQEYLDEITGRH